MAAAIEDDKGARMLSCCGLFAVSMARGAATAIEDDKGARMLSCCELFAVFMALDKGTGEIRAWHAIPYDKGARNPPSRDLFTAPLRVARQLRRQLKATKVLARYAPAHHPSQQRHADAVMLRVVRCVHCAG